MRAPFSRWRPRAVFVLVLAALAGAAGAREGQSTSPPRAKPPQQKQERPSLSLEDTALVQQLALIEQVELLRHLELFEKEPSSPPRKRQ